MSKPSAEPDVKTLLIDDDPFALQLLARQLERVGCVRVMLCNSAGDAVALLEAEPNKIDLVFCDLQMPDMDGVEFVRHHARIGYRGYLVLVSGEESRIPQTVQKLAQAHQVRILGALRKPLFAMQLRQVLVSKSFGGTTAARAKRVNKLAAAELARAIANGELMLHYQPKVDQATGSLIGVEALVRWQHTQAGLVFPDLLTATAEEHGSNPTRRQHGELYSKAR